MKTMIAAIALLAIGATALPTNAYAIGCLSGAAVGGVAGHYAGHHGVLGAAAGCAVGHHEKVVNRRRAEQQNMQTGGGYAPR
jgi:hypothetical protein